MFEVLISLFNSISIFISILVDLMPKYYEPPTENEKTNSLNESDCLKDCRNRDDCVQFVFFNNNPSCYLKNRMNLFKAISSNYKNATVKSIKSNRQLILCYLFNWFLFISDTATHFEHDAPLDEYNFRIKYLTPYGDSFESLNEIQIKRGKISGPFLVGVPQNKFLDSCI